MANQGFNLISDNPFVYQECDGGKSAAIGLDNASSLFKLKVLATAGATPTGTAHITIDPAAAGNITITPNGAGQVVLSPLGVGAVLSSSAGVLSSTGASTAGYALIANGGVTAPSFQPNVGSVSSGFATWGGAGNYFDDTTLGDFTLLRPGTGYINGVLVSWAAPQTVSGLTAGNTYLIYIDSTGTIGKTTTYSLATFTDNIVLFECMRDSTPVTNNQLTVKENHPYDFEPAVSYNLHETVGCVIENNDGGANIALNGTQKIQINGDDELSDHGLYTDIPDSGGVAVSWYKYYTTAGGKWARQNATDTFGGYYNNGGTPTVLGGSKFGVYTLYVSKDNLTSSTPVYIAVLDTTQYNNQAAAQTAIANGTTAAATAELAYLEIARLGYIIFSQASNSIVQVIISKRTVSSGSTTSGTNIASLVLTSTANFNGVLSAADTNVQAALDTIDNLGLSGTGTTALYATTFDTNVAAAGVTLSGTTLSADGSDTDININITAKGTGKVIVDDLQLTTDLAVTEGGTGQSTLTIHGLLVGNAANAINTVAAGSASQILTSGGAGADPLWTTATYPSTIAKGDVVIGTDTNVVGVVATAGATNGFVLTAQGAGSLPIWAAAASGGITTLAGDSGTATGATVTVAGTANQIVTSAAGATVTLALASSVTIANDITLTNGDANIINADAGTTSPITYFKKNRAGTTLTSGDLTGTIKFSGHDGTQYTDSARITSTSSGTIANQRVAGDLKFYTHPNSAAADPTLRMTIAPTGAITIAAPDSGTALSIDSGGILLKIGALDLSNGNTNTTGTIVVPSASSTLAQITLNSTNVNDRLLTTVGSNNVFLGYTCGNPSITNPNGTDNIGLGFHAAASLTTGAYNAFCGSESGVLVAGGKGNACLGYRSYYLATGSYNCSLGSRSLYNVTGAANYNISIGYDSSSAYTSNESSNIILNSAAVVSESNTLRIGSATGTGNKELKSAYICGIYTTAATPSGTAKLTLTDSNNLQYGLANTTGALLHVPAAGTVPIWSTGPTVTTLYATTFDTNVAAAGVTLAGTTLAADGSDTDISISITAKGAGKVIISDLQLTTDLAVSEGGTGASTLTDHGVLLGSGTGAITATAVGATGEVLIGNTGADASWSASPTVTTVYATTFDTNVAAAAVTLAGTTLAADGSDANINISITPKGTGRVSTAANINAAGISFDSGTNTLASYTNTTAWTPTVTFNGGNTGITYGTQTGQYMRIGNMVYIYAYVSLTSKGSSTGNLRLESLPVTPAVAVYLTAMLGNATFSGSYVIAFASTSNYVLFPYSDNASATIANITDAACDNDLQIRVSGWYPV